MFSDFSSFNEYASLGAGIFQRKSVLTPTH